MPRAIRDKHLNIRRRMPFEFIEIPKNFFLWVRKRLGLNGGGTDGMLIHHSFYFLDMQAKIIPDREVGNENIGFHLWVIEVIPARIFGLCYFGKLGMLKGKSTFGEEWLILRLWIFKAEVSFGFGLDFFLARH